MIVKKTALLIALIMVLISGCTLPAGKLKGQEMMDFIARPDMNSISLSVENWYVFHNDRIYSYLHTFYDGDEFFSTDLSGNDKKTISTSDDMRFAEIQLIHDDWMYYYTTFNQGVKKVNINTGEIRDVLKGDYLHFIPDTIKDGKVLVARENSDSDALEKYLAILDLNTGQLLNEKSLNPLNTINYYSLKHDKVYSMSHIGYLDDYEYTLYENNKEIYRYKGKAGANYSSFRTDKFIYILTDDKIIKLDQLTYDLVKEKDLPSNNLKPYNSSRYKSFMYKDGETHPYFQSAETPLFYKENSALEINDNIDVFDQKAYVFNEANMDFEVLSQGPKSGTVQVYGDYFVIEGNLETVVVNKLTGESTSYTSSHSYIDNGELYIMGFEGDFYYQETGVCNFKVVKVDLR